jgi:hypothetical protein
MRPCGPLRGRGEPPARVPGLVLPTCVHPTSGVVLISGDADIAKTALRCEVYRQG